MQVGGINAADIGITGQKAYYIKKEPSMTQLGYGPDLNFNTHTTAEARRRYDIWSKFEDAPQEHNSQARYNTQL